MDLTTKIMYENGKQTLFKRYSCYMGTEPKDHWTIDHVRYEQRRNDITYWRAYPDDKSKYFVAVSKEAVMEEIERYYRTTK